MNIRFGGRIAASLAALTITALPIAASAQEPAPDPEPQFDFGTRFDGIDDLGILTDVGAWASAGEAPKPALPPASAIEQPQLPDLAQPETAPVRNEPVALPATGRRTAHRVAVPVVPLALLAAGLVSLVVGRGVAQRRA